MKLTHALIAAPVLAFAVYRLGLRQRALTWGATAGEADKTLPGDELLSDADVVSTRAITIGVAPKHVWPWLVQMGPHERGGAYTYDWIENVLGLDMHSANQILPELQSLKVGDVLFGKPDEAMRVAILDPERALVFQSEDGNWVWAFIVEAAGNGKTRLTSRNRFRSKAMPLPMRLVWELVIDPGSLVMERKMLRGIQERAERLAPEGSAARR
jgi:hypothetical protein